MDNTPFQNEWTGKNSGIIAAPNDSSSSKLKVTRSSANYYTRKASS
jgi:hypothetical protein